MVTWLLDNWNVIVTLVNSFGLVILHARKGS